MFQIKFSIIIIIIIIIINNNNNKLVVKQWSLKALGDFKAFTET